MKFRKKPVEIQAFQFQPLWNGNGILIAAPFHLIPNWFIKAEVEGRLKLWGDDEVPYCMIETLEGSMKASAGDWIILGVKGEIYPCKPDIFEMTYEHVA